MSPYIICPVLTVCLVLMLIHAFNGTSLKRRQSLVLDCVLDCVAPSWFQIIAV